MSESQIPVNATQVGHQEYVVLGVATCFQRDEEGRLQAVQVAEPVPAAELECLAQGTRTTSYTLLYATTYGEIVQDNQPHLPADVIPPDVMPAEQFVSRVQAAARTYRAKPELKHLPLHESCTTSSGVFTLNHDPDPKRIINGIQAVSDADNVKQHAYTHQAL